MIIGAREGIDMMHTIRRFIANRDGTSSMDSALILAFISVSALAYMT